MDPFAHHSTSLNGPVQAGTSVTPDDSTNLPVLPRALFVGQGGDLVLTLADGQSVTLTGVVAGTLLPVRAARVLQTGTTAGAIVALW